MATNPQTVITDREIPAEISSRPLPGEEIVISGIAGLFPKSNNALELMENLYNKVDMVKEVKCNSHKHPGLPKYVGKINNTHKFDAQFFRVTPLQAASLDCLTRKCMENAFGAIYDSGINPLSLSGTKLGVFIGSSYCDVIEVNIFECEGTLNDFALTGGSKTMQANRISYWIDAKGPSLTIDQGCASSMACLELAYNSIRRGDCESAIVGGCNSCLHPVLSINLKNAGHLCLDGKTKCFDKNGDGYVRSEAVSLLFLQKAKDAKRIYAEICHIKGKFFTSPDAKFLPIRKPDDMEAFLEEFYSEVKVSPSEVEYVEAFGAGIAEADGNELDAIGRFFTKSKSVKVGSVKSNMGNTEAASGTCAVTKICLAYHKGELPANLHYNEPQDHIPAIRNGRVQVVTQNTPFNRGYTAINNYSYTGANYHVLLNGFYKNKVKDRYRSYIPYIILLSGREEQGIQKALDTLQSQPIDAEQVALLHNIYKDNFPGHTGRSYIVLDTNEKKETVCLARNFEFYSGTTRPVCFLYSGMGSQWCGMGTELMRIPIFAGAIERCRKVLSPLGVDIVHIITSTDKAIFDNILNSMVGICAVQIGLTDVLKAMDIVPDIIIGHSIGEVGCAYADGCFTAEETLLSAYYRGLVSLQTPFIRGSMAAVGLGHKDVLPLCPPEIQVACHNSANSSTISGPADDIKNFTSGLMARGIFAKEVACSNIAYHSKYIANAGPGLLSYMQNVIKEKKLRSDKWISTSVPQENWDQEHAKYASPEYFTNNLLSPVFFEESATLLPKDAMIIELAPHGLLQAILKKSHQDCVNLPITKRNCSDPVIFLLEAVGKLYLNGSNPQLQAIYPKVEFPVSIETPLLSHLVEFEHSVDWHISEHTIKDAKETSARNTFTCVHDDDSKFIAGHVRNGVNELPESALLVLVWETFGMYKGQSYQDMSVTFTDVTFYRQLKIDADDVLKLRILIHKGDSKFEVMNGNIQIVTGTIIDGPIATIVNEQIETEVIDITFNEEDVYTLLSMKGYSYRDSFRSIRSVNMKSNEAYVKCTDNWTTFLDSLIQVNLFARNHDGVSVPKIIQRLSIQSKEHRNETPTVIEGVATYKAEMCKSNAVIRCRGVTLKGVIFEDKQKVKPQPDVLFARKFIPNVLQENLNFNTAITINLQLVAENVLDDKINILELSSSLLISNVIKEISETTPSNLEINLVDLDNVNIKDVAKTNLYAVQNVLGDKNALNVLYRVLKEDAFVLTLEQNTANIGNKNIDLKIVTTIPTEKGTLVLLKKGDKQQKEYATYITIKHDSTFSWLPRVQRELQKSQRVVLISEKQPYCGLLGLVNSLRKIYENKISVVIVDDVNASSFSPDYGIFKEQLQKAITFNILKKGQWGSYYNLSKSKLAIIQNVSLTSDTFTDLDNFSWVETPVSSSKNLVKVSYAGLSAKDCQNAANDYKDNIFSFGMDFSGCDSNGKKLMGLVAAGALSSTVEMDSGLVWPVPEQWNLEDAATVPLPYVHAYYCLAIKIKLLRNQNVFVVGGCGALGQALISLCLSLDCTVFTTVGDERKKRFLLRLFPTLKEENIVCSYDELFYAKMTNITQDIRCHYVVNCSNGLLREAAMKCVGFMCTFLDVSDVDMNKNQTFGMSFMVGCKSYISVNLSSIFRPENYVQRKELQYMVAEGIAKGIVRPLSRVVYSPSNVSRAFRLVSSSKHRGRALIRMEDSESLNVVPRMNYSQGVHSVVCDKAEVGIELIDHLIKKGAKKCILNLKKTNHQPNYLNAKIVSWKKNDIRVEIKSETLQTKESCERLLNSGHKLGSVIGIYFATNNKEEINTDNIGCNDLKTSFDETVVVAANLDIVSRNMCKELRNFVIISNYLQGIGSEHAFSACENICEARKEIGLPALLLSSLTLKETTQNRNTLLPLSSLFNAMDISLKLKYDNILTLNLKTNTSDFNKKIERILGVENINVVDENLTLDNLYLIDKSILELRSELGLNNQSLDDLRKMSLASLKNVYNKSKWQSKISNDGLRSFYNYVEKDETSAFDASTPAKTLVPAPEDHGYLDRLKPHLMMIPGFEGRHQIFTSIAERLKIRAATLHLGPDMICDSIPEMAKSLANHIQTHFEIGSRFYILGYSFGVNVALEVAKILEAEGLTGVVYCLDSSPDALRLQVNGYTENIAEDKLQNRLLEHMCRLMTGQEEMELQQELEKTDSWSEKVEVCMKRIHDLVHFSNEHTRALLQSAYNRIVLAREYEPKMKLESELVLIRGTRHPKVNSLDEDYNLSKYTKQPVKVFQIESNHVSAPYDCRVPNIVNKMLDPQLLEEFKKKNLCGCYYLSK